MSCTLGLIKLDVDTHDRYSFRNAKIPPSGIGPKDSPRAAGSLTKITQNLHNSLLVHPLIIRTQEMSQDSCLQDTVETLNTNT